MPFRDTALVGDTIKIEWTIVQEIKVTSIISLSSTNHSMPDPIPAFFEFESLFLKYSHSATGKISLRFYSDVDGQLYHTESAKWDAKYIIKIQVWFERGL